MGEQVAEQVMDHGEPLGSLDGGVGCSGGRSDAMIAQSLSLTNT